MSTDPLYSFEIARPVLTAMALFQSDDENRFVLNNTQFEIVGNDLTLAATDGRRLAVHHDIILGDNLLTPPPDSASFCIDLRGVAKLPKVKGEKGRMLIISAFEKHAEITCDKYKFKADFCEAPFPKWRPIIPLAEPVAVTHFNVNYELLSSFGDAAKILKKDDNGITIRSQGVDGALTITLTSYRQFFGVLMPIRVEEERAIGQQDWVKSMAKEAQQEEPAA